MTIGSVEGTSPLPRSKESASPESDTPTVTEISVPQSACKFHLIIPSGYYSVVCQDFVG